jgi:TatA/E family protein of Tat protein translocase
VSIYAPDVVRSNLAEYIKLMLGVGGSEIIIIGLLFLLIFGPSKLPQMARDIGKFVGEARRSIDEFKSELTVEPDPDEKPARRSESRNGSKSKSSLKNKKNDEKDDEEPEDAEEKESEGKQETSQTSSRTKTARTEEKEEESELRDL